ncbi:MAG TPA: hypothetical protein VIW69_15455 [Candidatus Elarobacter sp.]
MSNIIRNAASFLALAVALTACTGGQIGVEPPTQVADVQGTTTLQFTVGTARYALTGATYLNTLVTYRQPNGLSGTLYNTPLIAGPAGLIVPAAAAAGTDAGTNQISGTPPTQPGVTAVATTFGQTGGAFAYGFAPENSTTVGTANYPGASSATRFGNRLNAIITFTYTQPVYQSSAARLPFLIGPPAVPDFHDGTFPTGFLGYPSGFTMFAVTPVVGTYNLTVTVPGGSPGSAPAAVKTGAATLASAVGLPIVTTPVIRSLGGGGASFTVAPRPAGTTNQVLYVVDVDGGGNATMYSFDATAGGTFNLSATSGPKNAQGVAGPPFADGDEVGAYVVAADYNILGMAPPLNLQPNPTLPAHADISVSVPDITGYDITAPPGTILSKQRVAN